MGESGGTVHLGHFTAREKAGFGGWVGAGTGLDILEENISVAPAKIWTPDLPAYILVILLIMLHHNE